MLKIAVDDSVERTTVVRVPGLTLLLRPAILDRDEGVRDALLLLTSEEAAIIRAAVGVPALSKSCQHRYEGILPAETCPCHIPLNLRSPFDLTPCPVHATRHAATA